MANVGHRRILKVVLRHLLIVLWVATCAAVTGYAGVAAWRSLRSPQSQTSPVTNMSPQRVPIANAAVRGHAGAPVAIIAYSDYYCDFCRKFAVETYPVIDREFVATGKVVVAFKHFPLLQKHPLAMQAAAAAECARRQKMFWPVHNLLFRDEGWLDSARQPPAEGLDIREWTACRQSRSAVESVQAEAQEAQSLGIKGTPTFIVGETTGSDVIASLRIRGAQPAETFRLAVESLIAKVTAVNR